MPTYDYQCRACGNTIELIHSMLEAGPETCERCGGSMRRILYPTGIIFRGSGFYKTDSRRPSSSSSASGEASASEGGADSKGGAEGRGSRAGGAPSSPPADGGSTEGGSES